MKTKKFFIKPAVKNQNKNSGFLAFTKQPPFKNFIIGSLVISLFCIIVVFAVSSLLPPELPLFYGLPEGKDQLAGKLYLSIPGGFALAITLVNLFIASLIKDDYLRKALVVVSFSVSLLALITTLKIILLVGAFPKIW